MKTITLRKLLRDATPTPWMVDDHVPCFTTIEGGDMEGTRQVILIPKSAGLRVTDRRLLIHAVNNLGPLVLSLKAMVDNFTTSDPEMIKIRRQAQAALYQAMHVHDL
jgi:hypothetical protein